MRIIVWGINYSPEETGIGPFNTGMCEWLAGNGHDVEMVTTFTYYPAWKKLPSDKGQIYRTDTIAGVKVRRCWHYVPGKVTSLKRIVHEGTFIAFSFLRLLFMRRPDVLIVVSPPLPLGTPARVLSFLWRRPYVFHVQDLQPDAAVGLGMLKPGVFTRVLYWLESVAYGGARKVCGISGGMLEAFRSKGLSEERVVFFPNWTKSSGDAAAPAVADAKSAFCKRVGLDAAKPLAVYSGNLGEKQGLGIILDAAKTPAGARVQWVIAGEGAGKSAIETRKAMEGLANVAMLPLQPSGQFEEMLHAADACLVTQQRGSGQFFFPSKLLTLLTHGRPVVAVADDGKELATAIEEGDFGAVVAPGDAEELAAAVTRLAVADREARSQWAKNGRHWVSRFDRSKVLADFEAMLSSIVARD